MVLPIDWYDTFIIDTVTMKLGMKENILLVVIIQE